MDRSYPDRNELVPAGHFGDGKDTSGTARNQSALTHGDHAVHHDEQRILISGNFKINPRMPSVVFPAHALRKYHILSIEPVHLQDDEYLVLQECASADCHVASVVRVWDSADLGGDNMRFNRVWITHGNKYFIWLKRLPEVSGASCGQGNLMFDPRATECGGHFTSFQQRSPPLMLIPTGALTAFHQDAVQKAIQTDPVQVAQQKHEGFDYVVIYQGVSTVRIKRMHATH